MPYSDKDDKDLPDNVKKMSDKDRAQWVEVWNSTFNACMKKNNDKAKCEAQAFKYANGVVKKGKKQSFMETIRHFLFDEDECDDCPEKQALSMPSMYEQLDAQLREQNREQTDEEYAYIIDVYMDVGNSLFMICVMQGHLYKAPVYYDGASSSVLVSPRESWIEVVKTFVPASMKQQVVFNVNSKSTRWFLMAATSVVNKRGEINSRAFFDKVVEYIDNGTHPYPKLDFFHQKNMLMGKTDFVARDGNVLIASGLFDDGKLAQAMIKSYKKDSTYYGASIQFYPTESEQITIDDGIELKVWKDGWLDRITICSVNDACSYMTSLRATEVDNTMDERLRKEIKKLADGDEELEKDFIGMVDQTNQTIEADGLITQTEGAPAPVVESVPEPEPVVVPVPTPEPEPSPVSEPVFELTAEAIDQIAAVVSASMMTSVDVKLAAVAKLVQDESARILQEQNTALASLRAVVTKLSQDDDAKHAEWVKDLSAQQKQSVKVIYRPRQAAPVTEDDTTKDLASVAEATLVNIH